MDSANWIKFSDPNKFSGKSQDVESYIKTIESRLSETPESFTTEFQKTIYFASWLGSGIPVKWYLGILESQPNLLHDYPAFVRAFTTHFGDPDPGLIETAHRQLAALRQTGSASCYVARFREIAARCKHSDYDMRTRFVDGLKEDVQLQLIRNCPEKLDDLYHLAIYIDARLYEMRRRREEFSHQSKGVKRQLGSLKHSTLRANDPNRNSSSSSSSSSALAPKPDPDATAFPVLSSEGNATENSRRRKSNLCFYCGRSGHQAKACPAKKGKSAVDAASALGKSASAGLSPFSL